MLAYAAKKGVLPSSLVLLASSNRHLRDAPVARAGRPGGGAARAATRPQSQGFAIDNIEQEVATSREPTARAVR